MENPESAVQMESSVSGFVGPTSGKSGQGEDGVGSSEGALTGGGAWALTQKKVLHSSRCHRISMLPPCLNGRSASF